MGVGGWGQKLFGQCQNARTNFQNGASLSQNTLFTALIATVEKSKHTCLENMILGHWSVQDWRTSSEMQSPCEQV